MPLEQPSAERCTLCKPGKPCLFHSAMEGTEKLRKFMEIVRKRGVLALPKAMEAGFAEMEAGLDRMGILAPFDSLSSKPLVDEFAGILEKERFSTKDLKELAAVALSIALLSEVEDDG